jgi:hypothetical protein
MKSFASAHLMKDAICTAIAFNYLQGRFTDSHGCMDMQGTSCLLCYDIAARYLPSLSARRVRFHLARQRGFNKCGSMFSLSAKRDITS